MLSFAFLVYDCLEKLLPQEGKKKAQQVPEVFFKAKVGQDKFYFSNVKLKAPLVIGIKFSKKS